MPSLLDRLPRLSYSVTRDFHGRWFTLLVVMGAIFVLGVLVPLNFALTGYETVSVFQSDFNELPDLWFWRIGGKPLPGSLCEPRILSVGDTVFTNNTLFPWTIETIFEAPPIGIVGIPHNDTTIPSMRYSGHNLDNCDVIFMAVTQTPQPPTGTLNIAVACNDTDLPIMMSTTYTEAFVHGQTVAPSTQYHAGLNYILSEAVGFGDAEVNINAAWPIDDAMLVDVFCPNQRLGPIDQSCTAIPASIFDISLMVAWPNGTINFTTVTSSPGNETWLSYPSSFDLDSYATSTTDTMQFLLAATRLDIGNVLPNNFLVYPDTLNETISKDSNIIQELSMHNETFQGLGDVSRPAVIASQYLCHFPQRKSLGSAIISVLVATLSMFGSAWAVFLAVATYYEKRKHPQGNFRLSEYELVRKDDAQGVVDGLSSQGNGRGDV
ncbi:hypothetical protein FRB94_013033 [Tulasnella sp. JGI-2019a]|nr:hypothetical protein FRB93_006933 [Tulasnella sp. JGI-2019a]KAG8990858.1 hypothetical protein FRB94_013033 [Tulasnella sp. JGI-2019a]KAG9024587.1 hypothetical protein FRB95_011332 [Tulasnella sp. JGI-2019a]